jgi:hypothetical protein
MNILPSATTEALPSRPQRATAEIAAVRPLDNPGERPPARREPQGSPQERDEAMARLRDSVQPETRLPLRGRRAVAAYTSLSREDEQSYMHQVLGFEVQI